MNTLANPTLSEEAIRPAKMMTDKKRFVDADRKFLLERRSEWVHVNCPSCRREEHRLFGKKLGFTYVECRNCGTVYTNPRPSQKLIHEFYASSLNYAYWNNHIFPATEKIRRHKIFRPRAKLLAQYCRQYDINFGTLLEVGSAFGTFCEEARRLRLFQRIIALEPTPDLAETCRKRGFETIEKPIEGVNTRKIADVLASFEVIEHLFDPRRFLRKCHSLLKPKGLLVLSCPNVRGFDLMTLRMLSNTFDHEHVNYFHPESIRALLEENNFRVIDVQTPGQLDADLVRKQVLAGHLSLKGQPLLDEILIERWAENGVKFQRYLSMNRLSSHMWVIAQKA
jgi:2-polyprenyl-3-methyl-5-hydroxy-6-metoxy-1,4-benzoquinol methylase/ribosomal protein S27E